MCQGRRTSVRSVKHVCDVFFCCLLMLPLHNYRKAKRAYFTNRKGQQIRQNFVSIRKEAIHTVLYAVYSMLSMYIVTKKSRNYAYRNLRKGTRPEIRDKLSPHLLQRGSSLLYHRERILKSSTLSCNEEKEEITKPPTR